MPLFIARQRHRMAWIALCAMLAMALWPTLSHALAALRGNDLPGQICTAQGMRPVAPAAEGAAGLALPASANAHADHCPCCPHTPGALGLPPAPAEALALPLQAGELPARFLQAPRTLHAWCSAQPRAPPTSG